MLFVVVDLFLVWFFLRSYLLEVIPFEIILWPMTYDLTSLSHIFSLILTFIAVVLPSWFQYLSILLSMFYLLLLHSKSLFQGSIFIFLIVESFYSTFIFLLSSVSWAYYIFVPVVPSFVDAPLLFLRFLSIFTVLYPSGTMIFISDFFRVF